MLSSVSNALRVLEHLVRNGESGVSEVARAQGLTVGTAFRLLATLVDEGFAERNPATRRYRAGVKMLELAREMRGHANLPSVAQPIIEKLMESTGETISLGVLSEDRIVYINRVGGSQPLAVTVRIGTRVPAYCTSLGRSILAFAAEDTREDYLSRLPTIAAEDDRKVPTAGQLRKLLKETRERGHSRDDADFADDISCIGAPVVDEEGRAVAAVSVSGPQSRIDRRRDDLVPHVLDAAAELSKVYRSLEDGGI